MVFILIMVYMVYMDIYGIHIYNREPYLGKLTHTMKWEEGSGCE